MNTINNSQMWECSHCGAYNSTKNDRTCHRCGTPQPRSEYSDYHITYKFLYGTRMTLTAVYTDKNKEDAIKLFKGQFPDTKILSITKFVGDSNRGVKLKYP